MLTYNCSVIIFPVVWTNRWRYSRLTIDGKQSTSGSQIYSILSCNITILEACSTFIAQDMNTVCLIVVTTQVTWRECVILPMTLQWSAQLTVSIEQWFLVQKWNMSCVFFLEFTFGYLLCSCNSIWSFLCSLSSTIVFVPFLWTFVTPGYVNRYK
jgi:hypothetical protein